MKSVRPLSMDRVTNTVKSKAPRVVYSNQNKHIEREAGNASYVRKSTVLHEEFRNSSHIEARKTCKAKPNSRKAAKGKGGSRPFVPWCDKKT